MESSVTVDLKENSHKAAKAKVILYYYSTSYLIKEMQEIIGFLKELGSNNNREWFNANRTRYEAVRSKVTALTERLIATLSDYDERAAMLTPSQCTYRIYRDTRFSHDKTPYKNHIGIFINPPQGKKGETLGYYLHFEPGNTFFATGTIGHAPDILRALRRGVYDNIEEYIGIVESPEFKKLFPRVGDDPVKTAPKGYPKEWEYIKYVRPRNFVACSAPLDEGVDVKYLPEMLRPYMREGKRFNDFHNFIIEEMRNI